MAYKPKLHNFKLFTFIILAVVIFQGCDGLERAPLVQEHLQDGIFEGAAGGLKLRVEADPKISLLGENRFKIILQDNTGHPVEDAHLNISSTSILPGMKIERTEINRGPAGLYETRLHYLSVGQWRVTVSIHEFGKTEVKRAFLLDVAGRN